MKEREEELELIEGETGRGEGGGRIGGGKADDDRETHTRWWGKKERGGEVKTGACVCVRVCMYVYVCDIVVYILGLNSTAGEILCSV